MQIDIKKVRVIDGLSEWHDQLVDISVIDGEIAAITAAKKNREISTIAVNGTETWKNPGKENEICISAGWVDVFADYREPGFEQKETIATGIEAAARGGFTDVLLAPNTQPAISSKSIIQYILGQAAGQVVNLHPIGAATQNCDGKELAEMLDMRAAGAIAFSDGWKPVQNPNLMLKALEYAKAFDGTIIQIPVDAALSSGGFMNEGIVSTGLGLAGIPLLAETLMVYRDIELLRYTGSRLHISGISTMESADMVRKAKSDGLAVTCSVTPYHLALTDEMLSGYDSNYKVSPPLRSEHDRMALIDALADGTIDCIASHHRPHEWDAKVKEFEYAADGMAVQEMTFNILWDALQHYINPARLVEVLATNPRKIFGLENAGISKNHKAVFTIFTPRGSKIHDEVTIASKSRNNPYIGQTLPGKVWGIYNNNKLHLNK